MDRYTFRKYAWAFFAGFLALCLIVIRLFQSGLFLGDQAPLTDVVVSEIGARNNCILTGEGIHDYIELYNPTAKTINLSGLGISDGTSSPRGSVPSGTKLRAGEYTVIALGRGGFDFGLSAGEALVLFDRTGQVFFTCPLEGIAKNTVLVKDGDTYSAAASPSPGFPNDALGTAEYEKSITAELDISISEICQQNLSLINGGDWIELVNPTASSVSHPEMYVSDERNNLFKIRIPAGILKAGETLLVDAGDSSSGRTFGLSEGETVYLSLADGRIADSLPVLGCGPDITQGRDGLLEKATPGYPNTDEGRASYLSERKWDLVLTEAMSWNRSYLLGPYGTPHDWFEIYNPTGEMADLSRYSVSKDADGTRYPVGEVLLGPGETAVIFADKDRTRVLAGYSIVDFGLSSSGCSLVLWKDGTAVDVLNIPALEADTSYGRDSGMEFVISSQPSPEAFGN